MKAISPSLVGLTNFTTNLTNFVAQYNKITSMHASPINKTALLLIDIQNDYFADGNMPLVGADAAADRAALVLQHFRDNKAPVIHIQHIATRSTATFFLPDTRGAEIHEKVKPVTSEAVFIKHYPNSFRETELLEYLQSNQITELVVAGMMTHMCVDATVRAAKDYGFNITLISDACATKDLQIDGYTVKSADVQLSFLSALSYYYATVTTTYKWLEEKMK